MDVKSDPDESFVRFFFRNPRVGMEEDGWWELRRRLAGTRVGAVVFGGSGGTVGQRVSDTCRGMLGWRSAWRFVGSGCDPFDDDDAALRGFCDAAGAGGCDE